MFVTHALLMGLIACAGFSAVVFGSLYYNPRLWLQDAPEAIQKAVPPQTAQEKRTQFWMAIPLFAAFLIPPIVGVLLWEASQGSLPFLGAFLYLWLVWMTVNVFDAVVIDWLVLTLMQPKRFFIPGTEHLGAYMNDMGFHIRAFFKGTILITVMSLIGALLLTIF